MFSQSLPSVLNNSTLVVLSFFQKVNYTFARQIYTYLFYLLFVLNELYVYVQIYKNRKNVH